MNRIGLPLGMLLFLAAGCSGIRTLARDLPVIKAVDLEDHAEQYLAQLQGDGVIVEFEKGDAVPVTVIAELPFASLESVENHLVFSKNTWILLARGGAFISPDGRRFAPVYDVKALKKLYGVKHGSLTIGFAVSREEGTQLQAGVSLH